MTDKRRLAGVALGRDVADLVLANGRVFEVLTGEFRLADIAIYDEHIAAIRQAGVDEPFNSIQTLNMRGRAVLPGFIDGAACLAASRLSPAEFGRIALAGGTTAVVADLSALGAVLGTGGLFALSEHARLTDLDVLFAVPVWAGGNWEQPAVRFDQLDAPLLSLPNIVARSGPVTIDALLRSGEGERALRWPAEGMAPPLLINAPGLNASEIAALAAFGTVADRGWRTVSEAQHKLAAGFWLLAGAAAHNHALADVHALTQNGGWQRCCLVSGERSASELVEHGHMTEALRTVVQAGVPAADAIRMVTSVPASLFGLTDRGVLLPGHVADITVVDDVRAFQVALVVKSGRLTTWRGQLLHDPGPPPAIAAGRRSMKVAPLDITMLAVRGTAGPTRIIDLLDECATAEVELDLASKRGSLLADPAQDVCKVAVIDRHHASGRHCVAFVRGLGLTSGALACSFGGAAQQLIVAGADDSSMLAALHAVIASQGGAAVAEYGAVTASLALPVAGLLSDLGAEELSTQLEALRQAATGLGCQYPDPFAALASLAAVELGGVRINEQGICDMATGRLLALQDRDTDWLGA